MNRDILNGTIDNGQSLNKYSYVQGNPVSLTDPFGLCPIGGSINEYLRMLGHTALDLLGFVPVVGFAADLANAYWYYREGNTFEMAASIIAAIPGLGDAVGGIIKGAGLLIKCEQTLKVGKVVSTTCRMIGAVAQTGVNMVNFDKAFQSVRQEYRETGHVSFWNGANAVLSGLGVVGGIAHSVNSAKNFNRMRSSIKSKNSSKAINPNEIRFSQSSVNGAGEIIDSMKRDGWVGEAIDVVRMTDGKLTTIDNTRVLAARYAGIDVRANIHTYDELLPNNLIERFTTSKGSPKTWGEAVSLRIGKQNSKYRSLYPQGSNIIGWKGN